MRRYGFPRFEPLLLCRSRGRVIDRRDLRIVNRTSWEWRVGLGGRHACVSIPRWVLLRWKANDGDAQRVG